MPSIEDGGVEKNFFIISKFLAKKIKNISVITANKNFNKKLRDINIINPNFNTVSEYAGRKWKYLLCLLELIKLIAKNKKITVFAFQANFYCAIVCKILFNVNLITRSNTAPSGWSQNVFKSAIFRYLFTKIDHVIVNSIKFKEKLKKQFNVDSTCIYNPLNFKEIKKKSKQKIFFPFFSKEKNLKIISVGRLVDQKDHLTLLKALNFLKNKLKFKALIIGKGVNREKIILYIKKNKLTKKIKLIKFQKNPFKYIKLSDLFVLTSRYEGLPNVLLEALTLGKYIISSNCPTGPREILNNGKSGDLFKVGDFKLLAKKIINYKKNKINLLKKIKNGQRQLYRFDSEKNLNKYLKIVKKFL